MRVVTFAKWQEDVAANEADPKAFFLDRALDAQKRLVKLSEAVSRGAFGCAFPV